MIIQSKKVWIADQFISAAVELEQGKITGIFPYGEKQADVDYGSKRIVPGFMDIHCHGAYEFDTNDAKPEGLRYWAKHIVSEGVTSFLATTVTQSVEVLTNAVANVADVMEGSYEGAEILGIHFEGPYLDMKYKGAQPPEYIAKPSVEQFKHYQQAARGHIRYVTLAPEHDEGFALTHYLTEHGVVVQDTAWEGYEEIPSWIMQGYGTMANEAADQLRQCSVNRPTHVFVQAGVGSLAGAVVGYFANLFPNDPPKFVVMEAEAADCLYQGALANDGKPRIVTGDLKTIMAGLACGEPNTISWDILRNHVSAFISCPDWVSAKGMRMLSSPVKGDPRVVSGESGAVGMGVLDAIMCDDTYKELRDALELDRHSRVLMFSTEGNTDPEKYRRVVWDGEYPTDDTPQKPC